MILQWSISLALLGPSDSLNQKMLEHLNRPHDEAIRLRFTEHFKNDTNAAWQAERAISFYKVANYTKSAQILESLDSMQRVIHRVEDYHLTSGLAIGNINVLQDKKEYSNYLALFTKSNMDLSAYSDKVQLRYKKYQHVKRKSILLAGLLSTIPGLGKAYCGYNRQAQSSVVVQSFFGIITAESIYRYGLQSAVGQTALSVSGLWWLSGIYGTMKSLKKEKRDRKIALIKAIWEEENRKINKGRTKPHLPEPLNNGWQKDSVLLCRLAIVQAENDSTKAEAEWRFFKACFKEGLGATAKESLKRLDDVQLSSETKQEMHAILPIFWFNQENYTEAIQWKKSETDQLTGKLKDIYNEIYLTRKEYQMMSEDKRHCISMDTTNVTEPINSSKVLPIQYLRIKKPIKALTSGLLYLSPPAILTAGLIGQLPLSGSLLALYTGYRIYGSSAEASEIILEKHLNDIEKALFEKKIECIRTQK